jgi:hypothetical protein
VCEVVWYVWFGSIAGLISDTPGRFTKAVYRSAQYRESRDIKDLSIQASKAVKHNLSSTHGLDRRYHKQGLGRSSDVIHRDDLN